MASALTEEARQSILEKGFWKLEDTDAGKRMDQILRGGFNFKSLEGLDLCKATALDDSRIRHIIESFFPRAVLGFYKLYGPSNHHYCVLNRKTPEIRILEVQLWSSGSKWIYDTGSQLRVLKATRAPNGLLKIPDDKLEQPGITAEEHEMPNGGLTLADARLGFKVLTGKQVKLGFMTPDEAQYWAKMTLPETLKDKVSTMECETIELNFEFEQPGSEIVGPDKK